MNNYQQASLIRLLTLTVISQQSDSEEFEIAAALLSDMFKLTVDEVIEYYEQSSGQTMTVEQAREGTWDGPTEEEVRADDHDPTTEEGYLDDKMHPIPITGPGWYRTASNQKAKIQQRGTNFWYGYVDEAGENAWSDDGLDYEGYHPWMIVARIKE